MVCGSEEMSQEYSMLYSGKMAWKQKNPDSKDVIIFIHGNSTSRKVFENQLSSPLFTQRLIALDLPGHGEVIPRKKEVV